MRPHRVSARSALRQFASGVKTGRGRGALEKCSRDGPLLRDPLGGDVSSFCHLWQFSKLVRVPSDDAVLLRRARWTLPLGWFTAIVGRHSATIMPSNLHLQYNTSLCFRSQVFSCLWQKPNCNNERLQSHHGSDSKIQDRHTGCRLCGPWMRFPHGFEVW